MFNSDIPVLSKEDDLLDRFTFSKSLADAIINYNDINSLSIGLFGE